MSEEPKTIRVKRRGTQYPGAAHWHRASHMRLVIEMGFPEFEGGELEVTVAVPKSKRERRLACITNWVHVDNEKMLDALEAIDKEPG